jgi:CDP-diacylglycerol---glycerol-3-phosphate 3-phosphatidyltransferase
MSTADTARASYEASRNEVLERIRLRDNTLLAFLGACGVIFGVAATDLPRLPLLVMIPFLALAATFMVTQHDRTIGALCAFITQDLAPFLQAAAEGAPIWESSGFLRRYTSTAMVLRSLSHSILVLTPAALALAWSRAVARSSNAVTLAWWIGVAAIIAASVLLGSTFRERMRHYRDTTWIGEALQLRDDVPTQRIVWRLASLPNVLTALRVVLLLPFLYFASREDNASRIATLVTFLLAVLTDLADGYFARLLDSVTDVGNVLDVLADRLLIVVALVFLMHDGAANIYLCLFVICREVAADSVRSLAVRQGGALPHNIFGRVKMIGVVVATTIVLLSLGLGRFASPTNIRIAVNACLAAAAISGVVSMIVMLRPTPRRPAPRNTEHADLKELH